MRDIRAMACALLYSHCIQIGVIVVCVMASVAARGAV